MNPSQSSIYRDLELLMQWYLPIGNKIAKDLPGEQAIHNLGNSFQQDLIDAMRSCRIALKLRGKKAKTQEDIDALCEAIDLITYHLEGCSSVFDIMNEYKSGEGPIVSDVQFANYLERIASLKKQIGGWRGKTASQILK